MTRDLAKDVMNSMGAVPSLTDVEDDTTITRTLKLMRYDRRDIRGVGFSAVWGLDPDVTDKVCSHAETVVDLRKAKNDQTIPVGSVTIRGDGTITDITIEDEYRSPSTDDTNTEIDG